VSGSRRRRTGKQRKFRAKRHYSQAMEQATRQLGADDRVRRETRRRRQTYLAVGLLGLGALIVLQHLVAHLANLQFLPAQDLLIGYPTGGLAAMIGLAVLPRR